jgi:hypothetical protein
MSLPSREPSTARDWEARLIEGGLSDDSASRIAAQLEPAYTELGQGSAEALIRGASLALATRAGETATVARNRRDVREVERLLGAFTGELEKLDEVLEVLAAYAQRMRTQPNRSSGETLH